eukprot:1435545-Amphidinium_carterae.1
MPQGLKTCGRATGKTLRVGLIGASESSHICASGDLLGRKGSTKFEGQSLIRSTLEEDRLSPAEASKLRG